jgi:gliding motility-associated-like protein
LRDILKQHIIHLFLLLLLPFNLLFAQQVSPVHNAGAASFLKFIENKGQWEEQVLFETGVPSGTLFLEKNALTYDFYDEKTFSRLMHRHHETTHQAGPSTLKRHAIRISFPYSNSSPAIIPSGKLSEYNNFYIGSDRSKWASRVSLFKKLSYMGLYEGVDMHLYGVGDALKYDFVIHPGSDVSRIKMEYEGADQLYLKSGKLAILTSVNTIEEQEPYAYQVVNGTEKKVACRFVLNDNTVSFSIEEDYDHSLPLVIDPVVVFSTYSGSTTDNFGYTATYDSKGHLYAGGIAELKGSLNYPVTPGAYQQTHGGGVKAFRFGGVDDFACDISISKYSPDGDSLLFATYLGGSDNEYPHSLVVDKNDQLVVMGTTFSTNFPTTTNCFDSTHNGLIDIFVSRFSIDGTALFASTLIGGEEYDGINGSDTLRYFYADDFRGDITPDQDNNFYICTSTRSDSFPTTPGAYQGTLKGAQDGCVFKLDSSLTTLIWSTYLGGTDQDAAYSIELDTANNVFIAGGTSSADFPSSAGTYKPAYQGGISDGYITLLNKNGDAVILSSFIGTSTYDQVFSLELDRGSNVYVAGQSEGNMPVSAGVYSNAGGRQFIMKLNNQLNTVAYSTVFGSGRAEVDITISAFMVDLCENVYVSGWGGGYPGLPRMKPGGSTLGLPLTPNAFQSTTDGVDFYLIALSKNAASLGYASYFGGNQSDDHVDGGTSRFDKKGIVYQSVCSSCSGGLSLDDFPVTPNAYATTNPSARCSNASFKLDFQISSAVIADFARDPGSGCNPHIVAFNNKSEGGISFKWDFGDSTSSTLKDPPPHTYLSPGIYNVQLIVTDSNSCNVNDTAYSIVTVFSRSKSDFTFEINPCDLSATFTNKSEPSLKFYWDFGDSTSSPLVNPKHQYKEAGTYQVKLITNPGLTCADSVILPVSVRGSALQDLNIPNIFSPNGDGYNDLFEIRGLNPECDKIITHIYNRWGQTVYESESATEFWNGGDMNKPQPLAEGVYFYILEVTKNNTSSKIHGTITLVR